MRADSFSVGRDMPSKSLEFPAPSRPAFLSHEEPPMNLQTVHPEVLNCRQRPDILTVLHDLIEHDALV